MVNLQYLIIGGIGLASGLPMLAFPRRKRLEAEATIEARKAELAAGADALFFEEERTLTAYPPPPTDRAWQIKGAILTAFGVGLVLVSFFR